MNSGVWVLIFRDKGQEVKHMALAQLLAQVKLDIGKVTECSLSIHPLSA